MRLGRSEIFTPLPGEPNWPAINLAGPFLSMANLASLVKDSKPASAERSEEKASGRQRAGWLRRRPLDAGWPSPSGVERGLVAVRQNRNVLTTPIMEVYLSISDLSEVRREDA